MRKQLILACLVIGFGLVLIVGCQSAQLTAEPTEQPSAALELVGPDETRALTLAELKEFPPVEGWGGIKSSTGEITVPTQFKGVSLAELCLQVGELSQDMGVRVVAKDGYAMTFSNEQITQGDFIAYDPATGDEVSLDEPLKAVLAYEMDGKPIPDNYGPFRIAVLTAKNNQVVDGHWSVKWVDQIVLKSLGQNWTLQLEGNLVEAVDRGTFESCFAEGCHPSSWTDDHAQRWAGVPLWLLLGYVDDEEKHGDYAYQEDLAKQGYVVEVAAADGYSVTFDSQRLNRNDNILVAAQMNENPLDEEYFPLRLVGSELEKKEMVGQIAKIQLRFSESGTAESAEASPTPEPAEAEVSEVPSGDAALVVTGAVAQEKTWSLTEFKALGIVEITAEHPKKGPQTNEGVLLTTLLEQVEPKAEAATLLMLASDGYEVEAPLAEVKACADCLLAINEQGQLKAVMPGMDSNYWVKDIIKIEVKK
jgi:hypothetical protein